MVDVRKSAWGLGLVLGLMSASAQAQSNLSGTSDPSLILLIWDPVAQVSYSRDTGLYGSTLYNQGHLSDAGSQQFWTLDPATDPSFAKYVQASNQSSSKGLGDDLWMVIGGGGSGVTAGTSAMFSTMINTVQDGTLNPQWSFLTDVKNQYFRSVSGIFQNTLYTQLANGNGTAYNNYANAPTGNQGSSFDTAASNAYVGNLQPVLGNAEGGLSAGDAVFGTNAHGFEAGNEIGPNGSSSWFYYMTPSATNPRNALNNEFITVSAFSNSAQLAYWGLATTTNSANQQELVLSFTQPSAVTQTATAAGLLRRNQTDYAAQYGSVLWISPPGQQQFAGWTPSPLLTLPDNAVTAVPEPESVLLMALGLGGVFAAAARRNRRTPAAAQA